MSGLPRLRPYWRDGEMTRWAKRRHSERARRERLTVLSAPCLPGATARRRALFEQFRPRVGNESIAIWHLHAWKRLRVEHRRLVDHVAFGQDIGRHGVDFV